MARKQPDLYIAATSGSANVKGEDITFVRGVTIVDANDPLYKQCRDHFKPLEFAVRQYRGQHEPEVEQATAAPGEKRGGGK